MPPKIIFVEGNIGTGKTTFLNLVQEHVDNVQCILEPVDKWTGLSDSSGKNILHYFYENMEKYTYSFQSYAFLSRVMLLDLIDYSKEYASTAFVFNKNTKSFSKASLNMMVEF